MADPVDHDRCLLISPVVYRGRAYPCAGLGYVGARLRQAGVEVRIVDTNFTGEDASPVIRTTKPCVVGITCESRNVEEALALAGEAKRAGHVTVLGGLHVSLVTAKMLEDPSVDYAIHGDGEHAMVALLQALRGDGELAHVPGLIYRDPNAVGGVVVRPKALTRDIESLPYPAYDLAGIEEIPEYPLITSRGCPYDCNFCTVGTISGRSWQRRSAWSLVDELLQARRRFNIRSFFVADEMFSLNLPRVKEFCRLLIKRRNNMRWSIMEGLRADRVDTELFELLRESGCHWVIYGIETFDEDVFEGISKGEKISKVHRAIKLARESGMKVGGYFVIGLPGSTFERDMRTIEHVQALKLDYAAFWMANPYFGTPLHDWVRKHATLLRPPIGDNIVNSLSTMPLFETPEYPAEQVKRAHAIGNLRMGYRTFYSEPPPNTLVEKVRHRLRVLEMILRYDAKNLPFHVLNSNLPYELVPGWRNWLIQRRPLAKQRSRERAASFGGLQTLLGKSIRGFADPGVKGV